MKKLQKLNRFFAALIIFVALFFINAKAQNDTNFYQFRNYYFQGYQGEEDTNEAGPVNQFKKFEYQFGPKFSPSGSVQKAAREIDAWIKDFELNGKDNSDLTSNWVSLGPNKNPINWEGASGVGRLICIAFDPINPDDVIYVGTPFGGVWKTIDGGLNWTNLNTDYQIPITKVSDIAINPNNNNMIYIATGDRDDYKNASISAGIYRTTDGGLNWLPVNEGLDFAGFFQISKILINPLNPNIAFAATSTGIYKTTNATTSCIWTELTDPLVHQNYFRNILYKQDATCSIIYASGKNIIKSTNGGSNWTSMTGTGTGLDFSSTTFEDYPFPVRINIDVTPNSPNLIYASAIFSDTDGQLIWNSLRKHFIFIFNGSLWEIKEILKMPGESGYNAFSHWVSPSWMPIAVSPINSNQIFFGNVIAWRSQNGGNDFNNIYNYNGAVHADCHDLKYSPDGQTLYIACDGGLFKLLNPDYSANPNYEVLNNGLAIGTVQKIGASQLENDLVLIGEFDCGSQKYDPIYLPDNPWKTILKGGDGCEQLVDYTNSDIMFSAFQKNLVYRSTNRMNTYPSSIQNPGEDHDCQPDQNDLQNAEFCSDYVMHPTNSDILYFNYTDLFKRVYNGNTGTWTKVSQFDIDFNLNCYDPLIAIGIAPNNSQVIYVAIENIHDPNPSDFQLFKTTSGGYDNGCMEDCWTELFPPNLPCPYITSIAVSPYDENRIWISYSGYVEGEKVKMFDGNLWSDYSDGLPNIPVNNLIFEHGSNNGLFAATDVGVYYINSLMEQWEPFMTNLPNVMVSELEINYQDNTIKAGTYGRGLWESPLPCTYINSNIEITSNQSWFVPMRVMSNITVKTGKTLTIKNNSTVYLSQNAKIIVERGGKLIIDGGTLTNACEGMWQGIEVWGTSSQPQNPAYQGWVQVINGGTIENSLMGIYTNRPDEMTDGWIPGYTGGIVQGTDAYFINNTTALQFFGYNYSSMSGFTDCEFVTKDDYIGSQPPNYFAEVTGMNGVNFKSCEFRNETQTPYYQRGIYSNNSYIKVEGKCLSVPQPCTSWDKGLFENLYYGIYATASTSSKYVDISRTDFTENFRGLYISGITNAKVTSNRFYINEPFLTNGGYGMYLNSSTGYWVEDNDFLHEGSSTNGIGLIVHNSGIRPNEIYRNRFNNLQQGISCQEQNGSASGTPEGLQILCNDFDVCISDILIPIPSSIGYGIASNQGSNSSLPQDMAGNLFYIPSPIPNNDYDDINNQGKFFTYYYPLNYSEPRVVPTDFTKKTVKAYLKTVNQTWSFENGCPPGIEGGGGGTGSGNLRTMIATANEYIEETEDMLTKMIDGGNTEELNTEVVTSVPPEAFEVYNELISNSPNLSETVVEASIEKENVLPNAMIRDVMVANPHTSKSDELMNKLDERSNPLPEYMKAQILEGRDLMTMKQELEANLANQKLAKSRAINELARYYLSDSINPQLSTDSLVQLYEEDDGVESKYRLVMLKLDLGEYAAGEDILEGLPAQYDIDGIELTAHQQMETFYEIVSGIAASGRSLLEADSNEVQQLAVLETEGTGIAAMYARNILISLGAINYDEPIQLPDPLKSSQAIEEYEKLINAKPPQMLEVYPNPSKDFVIIGYTTGEESVLLKYGAIEIQDVTGKTVQTITIKTQKDQVTVITKDWKPGIYIASLKVNEKIKESIKFTLVK
jgi:hypothetical protein